MADDLGAALQADQQLWLAYVPRTNLADGHCERLRAQLQWRHPRCGLIPASALTSVARKAEALGVLSCRALSIAAEHRSLWKDIHPLPATAFSPCPRTVASCDFPDRVAAIFAAHGANPQELEIIVPAAAVQGDTRTLSDRLNALRTLGASITVEGFDARRHSREALQSIPATTLILDRAFTRGACQESSTAVAVRDTIRRACEFAYRIVARDPGPMLREQLAEWGCHAQERTSQRAALSFQALRQWGVLHEELQAASPLLATGRRAA